MRPKSVFVAGFIGEINLLNGRVEHLENDRYRVLISGGESVLAFYEDARLREGEDVVLSLRPELVTLGGVPTGDTNSLDGEIEEAIYLGNHMRLRVRTQGGTEIWCHAPVERGVDQLERQVSIGWRITDARLLATDTGKEGPPSKDHQSPPTTGTSAE
jgi:putative spermidine/putrescine transport system ATP-binding protein